MAETNKGISTGKFKGLFSGTRENAEAEKAPTEPAEKKEEIIEEEVVIEDIIPEDEPAECETTEELKAKIEELNETVAALTKQLDQYVTTKDQFREFTSLINKKDSEMANRKLMNMLEQLSMMREDFFKLRKGVESKIDKFSAKDVLDSFAAYGVDMENILLDSGVNIGPFTQYDKLNTIHQRIVDVVPTNDESKNGLIAERVSDGYEYNGRVLFKERVNIYKYTETPIETTVTEPAPAEETVNETVSAETEAAPKKKTATKTAAKKPRKTTKKTAPKEEE